jgi:hypothetical protein
MNADSADNKSDSGLSFDLNRYKQAAELAYRYARTKADEQTKKENSPFDGETKKEPTNSKEIE